MESIGRYSAAVYRLSQSIFSSRLKHLEIGSGQYDIFLVIARNEGLSQKDIGDLLYIEKSTIAKAVKVLLSKGYISNRPTEADRRYSSLYLTEKGREAASEVDAVFLEILGVFSSGIPDPVIEQTVAVLKRVIGNLQAEKAKQSDEPH